MKKFIPLTIVLALFACASDVPQPLPKAFNNEAFVGLVDLGKNYGEVKLDYGLDSTAGELIQFNSCRDVDSTTEETVVSSQFHLLRLMKYNCMSAEMYHEGDRPHTSYFPPTVSRDFLDILPATAVPNLGGESLQNGGGTLEPDEADMKVVASSDTSIRVSFDDMDIEYVELARADFDSDGVEDVLLRLDWSIVSAFGQGFDLLVLNRFGPNAPVTISRRFPVE